MTQGEFRDRINKVIIESEKKIQGNTELLRAIDKLPIGNVSLHPNWPRENNGTIRFHHQNLIGINPDNDLADFEALMHQMLYNAPNFLSFNELNLELNFPGMESRLKDKVKEIDMMAKMNLA